MSVKNWSKAFLMAAAMFGFSAAAMAQDLEVKYVQVKSDLYNALLLDFLGWLGNWPLPASAIWSGR